MFCMQQCPSRGGPAADVKAFLTYIWVDHSVQPLDGAAADVHAAGVMSVEPRLCPRISNGSTQHSPCLALPAAVPVDLLLSVCLHCASGRLPSIPVIRAVRLQAYSRPPLSPFVTGRFPLLTGFCSKDGILECAFAHYTVTGTFAFWLGALSVLHSPSCTKSPTCCPSLALTWLPCSCWHFMLRTCSRR